MQVYLVGGAVREMLLGLPIKDRDFLVVGGSEQEMLDQGYIPVGKDFPVFLHPHTKEEYALARIERKTGAGYLGFSCDSSKTVTLEDDLFRRDLTINAMAIPVSDLEYPNTREKILAVIRDPFDGLGDIEKKVLRHVSDAFAEDPVRVLRVGRFMARYAHLGFHVAIETIELMRQIVERGEIDNLVAERVWKELERALGERDPDRFFQVLKDCGAYAILFPALDSLGSGEVRGKEAMKEVISFNSRPEIRLAAYLHVLSTKEIEKLTSRFRFPNIYRDLALLVAKYCKLTIKIDRDRPEENSADLLSLYKGMNVIHQMERFADFLLVTKAIAISLSQNSRFDMDWFAQGAKHFREESSIITTQLVSQGLAGKEFGKELERRQIISLME